MWVLLLYCMIKWNAKQWLQEWVRHRSGSMSFCKEGTLKNVKRLELKQDRIQKE